MLFFCILLLGDSMKVYIDLVLILNLYLDFLLLMTTSIVLKRSAPLKKIGLGAIVGSLSTLFLFWNTNNILLFFFKIGLACLMNILTFGFKDIKYFVNNFGYFYMISVILGGFLYYLNLEFSYSHIGLIFINKGLNINAIFLIIFSPVILYIYYRQAKKMKSNYNLIYEVTIILKEKKKYTLHGFLDTGNKLVDPITNKPIILLQKGVINEENIKYYYVPFNSLNNHNLIKCLKPERVEIQGKTYKNYLLGISDKKFSLEGVECILNNKLMEDRS